MDEEVLQDLLRTDPQNVGAAEALARILSDEQRWDELAQLLLERLEMGDQPRATLYRRLAELMDTRLQAPDNALVVLVEALYELHDDALLGDALDDLANRLDQWPTLHQPHSIPCRPLARALCYDHRLRSIGPTPS